MKPTKDQILALLAAWISQRPGLDFGNYCSGWNDQAGRAAYRAKVRSIGKDLQHARQLLRAVELSSISGEDLAEAFRAYSGRLSLRYGLHGKNTFCTWGLDYCTGQYWPTEYRRAACAVLASALWAHKRDHCMPAPNGKINCFDDNGALLAEHDSIQGKTPGDWLRHSFRRDFGRAIASRWFD